MAESDDRRLPALVIAATAALVLWHLAATAALREERRRVPEAAPAPAATAETRQAPADSAGASRAGTPDSAAGAAGSFRSP